MVGHVVKTAQSLGAEKIITVVGPDMQSVSDAVSPNPCVIQKQRNGTGDAVKVALDEIKEFAGDVLVLYGDVPMVSEQTLQALVEHHGNGGFGATILAMAPPDPTGYGRILQNQDGSLKAIIEQADASDDEKQIRLVNSGLMVIDGANLSKWISRIESNNAQGEYYLTDLPKIIQDDDGVCGVIRGDYLELRGVNTRAQLAELEEYAQTVLRHTAMDRGVTLLDPKTVHLSWDTEIGQDVVIGQNVVLGPGVAIEQDAEILPFSHIEGATIKRGASVGPYARIRPKSVIGEGASVGNFIEVNRSTLQSGVKAKHVSYLGDSDIGEKSNIGAGTVIANYDGQNKQDTSIGKNVFVGSNTTIVAPVKVSDGAIIGAGSVVTNDIPKDALALARAELTIKDGHAVQYRDKIAKKKTA